MVLSIVSAAVVLALLIVVHETGHFLMAKRLGVRVLRFSIGYPPKVVGMRWGETEYALGATPFGGYVKMLGEEWSDGHPSTAILSTYLRELALDLLASWCGKRRLKVPRRSQVGPALAALAQASLAGGDSAAELKRRAADLIGREPTSAETALLEEVGAAGSLDAACERLCADPPGALLESLKARAFPSQSLGKRAAIVLAGPGANLLFAPLLMAAIFIYGIPRLLPVVGQVRQGLPAALAGVKPGDRVAAVDGRAIASWEDLSRLVKASDGRSLLLRIERKEATASRRLELAVRPVQEREAGAGAAPAWIIGVLPSGAAAVVRVGPVQAVRMSAVATADTVAMLMVGLAHLVSGAAPLRQALSGPIMIARMAGQEAQQGIAALAAFTVMLSLELGIINLFPVPMLDGGHLLFFLLEGLRGRPLKLRHREIAMQVGLLLLAALMVFVIVNDISRIVQG
ncbi:MAG: RIP metalloprotease RseP [Deltaproteobacteria bacterium]|jgi:regulator of sigma E protease|nr:RIP metalloprotease RseP [Deltaproteobacteria bacterium]